MHQHGHPHAFTPIPHRCSTILPAPGVMGTQDRNFNTQLPTQTSRSSFAPVSAFRRATQKSVRPPLRGRWGALHVCIAWKIHYHKQLKQMQQKPNSLHQEHPATSLPDSVRHKESKQPSCMHPNLDFPCGPYAYGNICDSREIGKISHNRSQPSDLHTSSPASCHSHATKREKSDQSPNLHWKEKPDEEKHRSFKTDSTNDLPLKEKSQDPKVTPELDGRHSGSVCRKRQLECESLIKAKRVKQEILDNQLGRSKTLRSDPPPLITTRTHSASHTVQVQHMNISDLSVLYPNSSRCSVSYPVTEINPYKAASSWDQMWDIRKRMDLHFRQNVLKDYYSLNSCKVIRMPFAVQRQQEAFHSFFAPHLHFPALRQQDTVYLRGRETLAPRDVSSPLQMSTPSSWHCGRILPGTVNLKGLSDKKRRAEIPITTFTH